MALRMGRAREVPSTVRTKPLTRATTATVDTALLNLLFVLVFHMGVEGVAISTSIANALSAFLMVRLLRREEVACGRAGR